MTPFRRTASLVASLTLAMAALTSACASREIVTQSTLAPVDRSRVNSTAPSATGTSVVIQPVGATVIAAGDSSVAGTTPTPLDSAASTAVAGSVVTVPIVTLAMGKAPSPTTVPTTTIPSTAAATSASAPPSVAPPVAGVGTATCVAQSFGRGIDADTIKLVEKALNATQNGDFDKLMADLQQWVVNGPTILDKKWRQQGFKTNVQQIYFLTFYALGVVCPNYTFLDGEMTLATAPYKPPVGGCLNHAVPLDASTGGAFPNADIKVVQQALYSLNLYYGALGGTPGTQTMAAIYKAIGGGYSTDNPLHALSTDQLAQLQISC